MPYPTEFPAEAAAKIGQAVLSKSFTVALLEPAYDLQGYAQGRVFGGSAPFPNPVRVSLDSIQDDDRDFSDEAVASLLLDAGAERPGVVRGDDRNVEGLPWLFVLRMVVKLIAKIV